MPNAPAISSAHSATSLLPPPSALALGLYSGTTRPSTTHGPQLPTGRLQLVSAPPLARYPLSLEQRVAQLEAALDTAPLGLASVDLDFRYVSVNQVFACMHGRRPEHFLGRTVSEALPHLAPIITAHLEHCLQTGSRVQREMLLDPHPSDPNALPNPLPGASEPRVILRTCQPIHDSSGEIIGISAGLVDITERKRAEIALRESEENYRYVVELNPHIPWSCTPDGSLVEMSPRWTELTGCPSGLIRYETWVKSIHPLDLSATLETWAAAKRTGDPFDVEYRVRSIDGSWLWVRARAAVRRDAGGAILRWYGILEDIHERKRINEALREKTRKLELATAELALRVREDHLTGLANRRHFDQMLHREVHLAFRTRQPLALIMIDVDHFKDFNDTHGHQAGDQCLRQISSMLRQITRNPADTVARYGGEEFAIVLPNTSHEQALSVATRALTGARALDLAHLNQSTTGVPTSSHPSPTAHSSASASQSTHPSPSPARVTISAGLAILDLSAAPRNAIPGIVSALIERADTALYSAKNAGRDQIITAGTLAPTPAL